MPLRVVVRTLIVFTLVGVVTLAGAEALGSPATRTERVAQPSSAGPRCFGAASLGTQRPCHNPALSRLVKPLPRVARHSPNAPCDILDNVGAVKPCAFGAPLARASQTIALVGDSH